MFFAIMLVCSPANLINHGKECFGVEDTMGFYTTEAKCYKRISQMENEIVNVLRYPVVISKNCIKIKLKSA